MIKRWVPSQCVTERDYEDSLYEYLHRVLPTVQIARQYAKGRSRVDMRVGDKVVVELKTDLTSTGEYQRLLGQLLELKRWDEFIVVVLTGETDPYFPKALLREVRDWGDWYFEPKVRVVQK